MNIETIRALPDDVREAMLMAGRRSLHFAKAAAILAQYRVDKLGGNPADAAAAWATVDDCRQTVADLDLI